MDLTKTLDTLDEPQVEAQLLDALSRINDRRLEVSPPKRDKKTPRQSRWVTKRRPMKAEWLKESKFQDINENRDIYYAVMDELVTLKLVAAHADNHGSACTWVRYSLTNSGYQKLQDHRMLKHL